MTGRPVVFIHGLWLHATSWTPWMDLFRAQGYQPIAPGWPGEPDTVEEARTHPELVADTTIDAATEHFADIIANLDDVPVLVGHSFGGLISRSCSAKASALVPSRSTRPRSRACCHSLWPSCALACPASATLPTCTRRCR
jgi:alpha-beta hydrolase superfamily lysophospholipase